MLSLRQRNRKLDKHHSPGNERSQECGEKMLDSMQKPPRAPPKSFNISGSVVSAGLNDQTSKTILPAVLGPIIFPFKWWKSCLSIRGDEILLIKDPLKGKEWGGWGERMKEQEGIMERDCS